MRAACLGLGTMTLAALWLGPLPALAREAFAAHMTMHMGVVAVAAPLLARALAGAAIDPVRRVPVLFGPIVASVVELVVVWGWHAPTLHHVARHATSGLVVEQATFLLAGVLVWLSVLGGDPRRRPERAGAGIVALLLTSMHMTLLGALLALPARPLYPHTTGVAGLTPSQDQQLGGAIMLAVGGLVYLLGALALTAGLLKTRALDGAGRA
jgi:putative membrane protein